MARRSTQKRACTHARTHTHIHSLSLSLSVCLSLSLSLSHAQVILPYNDEPSWLWRQFRDTVLELSWEVRRRFASRVRATCVFCPGHATCRCFNPSLCTRAGGAGLHRIGPGDGVGAAHIHPHQLVGCARFQGRNGPIVPGSTGVVHAVVICHDAALLALRAAHFSDVYG
jgi:hypothetical protein